MASGLLGDFQPAFGITEDDWLVWSFGGVAGVRAALRSGLSKPPKNVREKKGAGDFFKDLEGGSGGATSLSPRWGGWSDPRPALRANIGIAKALAGLAGGAGEGGGGRTTNRRTNLPTHPLHCLISLLLPFHSLHNNKRLRQLRGVAGEGVDARICTLIQYSGIARVYVFGLRTR